MLSISSVHSYNNNNNNNNYNKGGYSWTPTSAPLGYWISIASDSTGQYLAAAQAQDAQGNYGPIYTSSSGGNSWFPTPAPRYTWVSITSDSTGQYLAAVSNQGGIYTSSSG